MITAVLIVMALILFPMPVFWLAEMAAKDIERNETRIRMHRSRIARSKARIAERNNG